MTEKSLVNSSIGIYSIPFIKGVNILQQKTYGLLIFHLCISVDSLDNALYLYFLIFFFNIVVNWKSVIFKIFVQLKFMWLTHIILFISFWTSVEIKEIYGEANKVLFYCQSGTASLNSHEISEMKYSCQQCRGVIKSNTPIQRTKDSNPNLWIFLIRWFLCRMFL